LYEKKLNKIRQNTIFYRITKHLRQATQFTVIRTSVT